MSVQAEATEAAGASASSAPAETELRYVPEEIPLPDGLESITGWNFSGDTLWFAAYSGGAPVPVGYNTLSGEWFSYDIDAEWLMHNPSVADVSAAGDSVWVMLAENADEDDLKGGFDWSTLGYYVYYFTPSSDAGSLSRLPISGDSGSEGGGTLDFASLLALDEGRALLTNYERAYLLDSSLSAAELEQAPAIGTLEATRAGDALYIYTNGGIALLDTETLALGEPLEGTGVSSGGSNAGRLLNTETGALYVCEPSTGEMTELFGWLDVALSYGDQSTISFFENSSGEIFYPGDDALVRVTQQELPKKQVLKLACFASSNEEDNTIHMDGFSMASELYDAIIRFNNTDSEYRIEAVPLTYSDDAERDRLLIQLATGSEYDIVDTSLLPENALDAGVLTDLLPYIDADEDISRDDFIGPLFSAMQRDGGLYEYCHRYSLLSLIADNSLLDSSGSLTAESVQTGLAETELEVPGRDRLIDAFLLAATAEFIDWDSRSCSFDSAEFRGWLELLASLPGSKDYYEQPAALFATSELAETMSSTLKHSRYSGYSVTGFPSSSGTGSYFTRLSHSGSYLDTIGDNISVGIMASSENKDGAWRFVKTLMLGGDTLDLTFGIPVLKSAFESAFELSCNNQQSEYSLTEEDAELLRYQVYNTSGIVRSDESLLNILSSEAQAFFAGQKTADAAAKQIQSRVSIYLAEQG